MISIIYSMIFQMITNQTIDGWQSAAFPKWEVIVGVFDIDDESGEPTFIDWYRGINLHEAIAAYRGHGKFKADDISIYVDGKYQHYLSLALQEIANN